MIILEPWRCFKVINEGVRKDRGRISIVPLELIEEELIYEKEIQPGVCRYIIKALKENIEDKEVVKKMLNVLHALPFNNKCKLSNTKLLIRKSKNHSRRQPRLV